MTTASAGPKLLPGLPAPAAPRLRVKRGGNMRLPSRFDRALIPPSLLIAALTLFVVFAFLAPRSAPGLPQANPVPPPAKRPEVGIPGSKQPTTKPGSHESSAKDERDRVAGKFPPPKERGDKTEEERRAAEPATAYVDVTVLESGRQALTLTRDDFRVLIDDQLRNIVSIHYVFRGPQALDAGRSVTLAKGVVARGDESRTVVVVVDENSFPAGDEAKWAPAVQHTFDVTGPADRTSVVALPQASSVKFAGTRADMLAAVSQIVGRANGSGSAGSSFAALARVFTDLVRVDGPKQVIYFTAGHPEGGSRRAANEGAQSAALAAAIDAAAASRSTVHVVTPSGRVEDTAVHALMRTTGGSVTRITGQGHDLEPLGAALLGGYVLEVASNPKDRDGHPHALSITAIPHGLQVLAATRWMPRRDPLPPLIVRPTQPPG